MNPLILHFILALSWMLIGGFVCLVRNNNGLVDIFWGSGFAWISLWTIPNLAPQYTAGFVLNLLVWVWALRLSIYLFNRNWNKAEDFRYADFRKAWKGSWTLNSIVRVYLLQGVLLGLIAFPITILNRHKGLQFTPVVIFGIIFSILGIITEGVSDSQKNRFKSNPDNIGKICQIGLWKYSRHPNYFGEILMWWGFGIAVLPVNYGYVGLFSASLITFLLYRVSGVPFLEKKRINDPEFQKYKLSTGAILPKFFMSILLFSLINYPGVAMAVEEPKFTVETKTQNYEIRSYGPTLVAETEINGNFEEVGNQAFRILADYIFGNNKSKAKIAMTAPVSQKTKSENISMTAPVNQIKSGNGFVVQFTMPEEFTKDTLPEPNDSRVHIKEITAHKVAVYKYSGTWSESRYKNKLLEFQEFLKKDGIKTTGEPTWARFDPPFMPWFLRRNEIWLEIAH